MQKVVIIGFGSIGRRHAAVFRDLGSDVSLVTAQRPPGWNIYDGIPEAVERFRPDIVIIANDTALHEASLRELAAAGFQGTVMVEKPLGHKPFRLHHPFSDLLVSYNMRMHPVLATLKAELAGQETVAANLYCGQYLPDWRPGRDYRQTYSARKDLGGGVLRDLSHELDYACWLLGPFSTVAAHGGHFSDLEIVADDVFTVIGESASCRSVAISLNYLDRVARRTITVQTNRATYHGDLIAGCLAKDREVLLDHSRTADTYVEQARRLLERNVGDFCTFSEGLDTLHLIEAAERSCLEKRFISL